MKRTVNVHEAKTHLSRLLDDVEHGDEITIARAGVPCAKLVPLTAPAKRELGLYDRDFPDSVLFEPISEEELQAWEEASDPHFVIEKENGSAAPS